MLLPCSMYSDLLIHSWWNVPNDAKMLPPNQELKRLSTVDPAAKILGLACGWTLVDMGPVTSQFDFEKSSGGRLGRRGRVQQAYGGSIRRTDGL